MCEKENTNESVVDKLETLILLSLDARHDGAVRDVVRCGRSGFWEMLDKGTVLPFDQMKPASAYALDLTDTTRIYARTTDYLLQHPAETLGDEAETIGCGDGLLVWRGFRRLKKPPKDAACLGRPSHWYEMHERVVRLDGVGGYIRRLVALDSKGQPLLTRLRGQNVCEPGLEGRRLLMCASVIEDAYRANTMLASVKDAAEIKFPVPIDDYKEVFAKRDGPMNGARRKAIVHWVAKHLRHSALGNEFPVKKHIRGVQEFTVDGLRIKLTPNDA